MAVAKFAHEESPTMAEDIRPEPAVRAARAWLAQIYAEERIARISLEEVRFRDGNWEITLGFNREEPDEASTDSSVGSLLVGSNPLSAALRSIASQRRIYKVIVVAGNDNHVKEMRDREVA
jgi:hypothetical protein